MLINPGFTDDYMQIVRNKFAFEMGKPLPFIARIIIKMGLEAAIKLEVEYGVRMIDNNTYAGYYITAPEKDKRVFLLAIYIEDESPENIQEAVKFMEKSIEELKKIPNI